MSSPTPTLPLQGIRVLDCSEGIAGPKATMLLGDFGAEVLKIELPGGDPARADPGFPVWNRNKKGAALDWRDSAGRDRLLALIAGADVCIFNAPLADLEPLGLDPGTLTGLHPRLVYVHVPAFTTSGPESLLPESAQLLSAASGVAYEQYSYADLPVDPVFPHLPYAQAMWAATSTVAALIEREHSGFGQAVTVSGLHATVMMMTGTVTDLPAIARGVRPGGGTGPIPFFRLYRCADGEWLILAALTQAFYLRAFEILDVLDLLADPRLGGEPAAMALPANAGWVIKRLAAAFNTRPRDEWLALFREAGLPAGPVRTQAEWFDHEQIRAIGMRNEVLDPERGPVTMPGIPVSLSLTPGAIRTPAPVLGGSATLPEWPVLPAPGGEPARREGPLAGLRVLDLGVVIAGSFGGTLFAELGADVIKVEPKGGDSLRAFAPTWIGYNKGKRSAVLDLQSDDGREAFYALVRTADVVIDNFRPGVLERLRLDYESLRAVKPEIITVSVTGYGEAGPLRAEPGFDPVLQAGSGMMRAQGGEDEPTFLTLPVTDTPTALAGTLGACIALLHRLKTGQGQRVTTSLAALSVFMQSGELASYAGRPASRRGGRDFQGPAEEDRYYATADGWLRVQARAPGSNRALLELLDVRDGAGLSRALTERLARLNSQEAASWLRSAGVPAVPVFRKFHDFYDATASAQAEEAMTELQLTSGERVWVAGRYAHFQRTPMSRHGNPPGLGEHTREVLAEAGLDQPRVEALLASGVAVQGRALSL